MKLDLMPRAVSIVEQVRHEGYETHGKVNKLKRVQWDVDAINRLEERGYLTKSQANQLRKKAEKRVKEIIG